MNITKRKEFYVQLTNFTPVGIHNVTKEVKENYKRWYILIKYFQLFT